MKRPSGNEETTRETLLARLFEGGRRTARAAGTTKAEEETLVALRAYADRAVVRIGETGFNPARNRSDRLADDRHSEQVRLAGELKQQADFGRAAALDRELELAAHGEMPEEPEPPYLVAIFGVLGIALTVSPTLHDVFFASMLSGTRAVTASIIAGSVIGGVLVAAILGRVRHHGDEPTLERVFWLGAGIAFGSALYVVRRATAANDADRLLALGFALLEATIVLVIDLTANRLNKAWGHFRARRASMAPARELALTAKAHALDRATALRDNEARREAHERDLRRRDEDVVLTDELREAARAAIVAGYMAGVKDNVGHLHGAAFAPPRADLKPSVAEEFGADTGMNAGDDWLG